MSPNTLGLYVHIPFCARKCTYCDFASFAGLEQEMPRYIRRLQAEIAQKSETDREIATLFIGGGTPSLLPPQLMKQILSSLHQHFRFLPDAECSCECNPGTVTKEFLAVLKEGGINRLSFGAQASQPRLLQMLGRIHTWDQVAASVALARETGFDNINLDLMLGLPTQTIKDVKETLLQALVLSPQHLSCYGLIVEDGTEMQRQIHSGVWALPDEETERDMYELCRETLLENGFAQYEISNFALPGFACRHNVDCWRRKEYLGLGSAACGFVGSIRYQNPPSLTDYLNGVPAEETFISPADARFESIMLGLRMMEGVSEDAFYRMHGVTVDQAFGNKLQKPIAEGLLLRENGFLRLTRRGMDVQNRVLVEFL
ncbi:MAG: radical SAM family heme chaperone HemW [Clostridia bacterium]|nr:radical SAM family heme chaperone HemW [Clostridia bacterium]